MQNTGEKAMPEPLERRQLMRLLFDFQEGSAEFGQFGHIEERGAKAAKKRFDAAAKKLIVELTDKKPTADELYYLWAGDCGRDNC